MSGRYALRRSYMEKKFRGQGGVTEWLSISGYVLLSENK